MADLPLLSDPTLVNSALPTPSLHGDGTANAISIFGMRALYRKPSWPWPER